MSTISGVSGSSNAWAALNTQRSQHQAKMFAKVDTDGSGGVDQTELGSMLSAISEKTGVSLGDSKELFTQMDSNSDGSLSSDELGSGMQAQMPPPPSTMEFAQSRGMAGSDGSQDDLFAKVDTDGDGSVNKDELKVLTDRIKEDTGQDLSEDFAKLDTDSDGKLSQTEFETGRPQAPEGSQAAQGPEGAGGARGPGGPGGAQGASSSDTTYDALDTNEDGTVSEVERLMGELRNAIAGLSSEDDASKTAANGEVAALAQKIYAQVANDLQDQTGDTLSVRA